MAVYAIGDIQGCDEPLQRLLETVRFDPAADRLWFVGDIVNRGPGSLASLRLVRELDDAAVTVLGNHDFHLLAMAAGAASPRRKDTLVPILEAPDRDELIEWLRHRPLLHHDARLGYTMVHAGLPPQWDLATAQALAGEVETALRGPQYETLMHHLYGDQPDRWNPSLTGWDRLRFAINCFTRMRYCDDDGRLDLDAKGPPGSQSPELHPWFQVPGRASAGLRIVFGHWSTLGLHLADGVYSLDTGCVWGGPLTALRLDSEPYTIQVPCRAYAAPGG